MKNINRNKPYVNSTELKYLYEIAAIPKTTRDEYLQILLKRKGATRQKNVRLLKTIYEHITEGKMIQWDSVKICNELDISWEMLWCHKSRLLKGLREFYFGWKEIEKKEFTGKNKDDLNEIYTKADRMYKLGMTREAKDIFLKLEKTLNAKRKSHEENILYFQTLRYLCSYYSSRKNKYLFSFFMKSMEKCGKCLIKKDKKLYSKIMSRIWYYRADSKMFHRDSTTDANSAMEYLQKALFESKKIKDITHQAMIIYNITHVNHAMNKRKEYLKYTKMGLELTSKANEDLIHFAFRSQMDYINSPFNKENKNDIEKRIEKYYSIIRENYFSQSWTIRVLYNLAGISSKNGLEELMVKYLYEYNCLNIIHKGYNNTFRTLFYMKFSHYLKRVRIPSIQFDGISGNMFLSVNDTDLIYNSKLDNTVIELSINTNKLKNIVFRKEFFTFSLMADFWKGKKCSLPYSKHIINQIDYINKTRPELTIYNKEEIDTTFLGIAIMSESQGLPKEIFLQKYEMKFKQYADSIVDNKAGLYLESYYMLSFIAEQCGYEELKEIVKDTFFKLQKKYPKEMAREIEKVENGEHEAVQNENELMGIRAA